MDPLSDVLRSVRLIGGVFFDAHLTAPWCVNANLTADDCKAFLAMPAQLIAYHFIIEGRLVLSVEGEPPIEVRAGEIVLFPRNDRHMMGSAPGLKPVSAGVLIKPSADGGVARISHGGGGEATRLVCGFLASEEGYNPLIAALPRVLTLDVREATSRDWIEASVRFAAGELAEGRLASSSIMSRLSETLLVEAVRHYSSTLADEETGWLNGLKDPHIGRALTLMHQNIRARMVGRGPGPGGRTVAQRLHGPLQNPHWDAAYPLPDRVASPDGQAAASRVRKDRQPARLFRRL